MRTEHLKECLKVAQMRSITQAARSLHLSQSALSTHINTLEAELGFRLFDRPGGTHTTVTSAGMAFLEDMQPAINMLDAAVLRAARIANVEKPLRVAFLASDANMSPELFKAIEEAPNLSAHFVDASEEVQIFDLLVSRRADVLFMNDFRIVPELASFAATEGISFMPLYETSISIAMQKGNPLLEKEHLSKYDLEGSTQLVGPSSLVDLLHATVENILGDVSLHVKWVPSSITPTGILHYDLADNLVFGEAEHLRRWYAGRSDIVVLDKLDGCSLKTIVGMAYRDADFDERYQAVANAVRQEAPEPAHFTSCEASD